jgi:hypothetical protein
MRRQLQLVLALGVLGAVLVAATAAGGVKLGVGQAQVEINLPGETTTKPVPACANLEDDDGDGRIDLDDKGCSGPLDDDEADTSGTTQPPTDDPLPTVPTGPNEPPTTTLPGEEEGGVVEPGVSGPAKGGRGKGKAPEKERKGRKRDRSGAVNSDKPDRSADAAPPTRQPDGRPTRSNPSVTIADFGPAPIGVPNFVIDRFSIPPFLLPIYQACGTQYGIPWEVLAAINRIETAFGTNLNVSSAGAVGWMQFLPSTWRAYGVDANNDGRKDPYNPVDAICAAARYLKAAGGQEDLARAIFAYNHADWYVDEVLLYARQYGRLPDDLVGSLTGLTEGARFPVAANARYADDISEREALRRAEARRKAPGNAADVISDSPTRRGINIYTRRKAPVVAVNDGVIKKIGKSKRLGRYIILQDAYGNRFTYARLGEIAKVYPAPKRRALTAKDFRLVSPGKDRAPEQPASATDEPADKRDEGRAAKRGEGPVNTEELRERLYAFPEREANLGRADVTGQLDRLLARRFPGYDAFKSYFSTVLRFDRKTMEMRPLREGSKVAAGTVLGRVDKTTELAPHLHFAIKPVGRGAPSIDPKPILDGWKLLEATAIYRAAGKNPFAGNGASVGQILLMSKEQLIKRTLRDPNLEIYSCGRQDIRSGQIDRRVLALLSYLSQRGYRLTVTSLKCGHSIYTSSGNISHHSVGAAVDIARINGLPVLGNQGQGSITEALIRDILRLQGTMEPDQVISLMDMGGPTFVMADHADHVHVGYQPHDLAQRRRAGLVEVLKPDQWTRLIRRIAGIENPEVPTKPSRWALPVKQGKKGKQGRASHAHVGE